jgi:hypothetical protein
LLQTDDIKIGDIVGGLLSALFRLTGAERKPPLRSISAAAE